MYVRGCAAADFYVVPDGRIRVRLLDRAGQPLRAIFVDLIDLDAIVAGRPYSGTTWIRSDGRGESSGRNFVRDGTPWPSMPRVRRVPGSRIPPASSRV